MIAPRIGGMLVGYHAVCPRKAWLSMRGLWMEGESEDVALGRLLDQHAYARRHRPHLIEAQAPDGTALVAKIDGAHLREGVLYETKKGRSCEEAHRLQLQFYLWVLGLAGITRPDGEAFTGQLGYPALRRTEAVALTGDDARRLEARVAQIAALSRQEAPPERHPRRSFCKRCAFEELCYG